MRKVWQCGNVKLPCRGNIWYFLRTAIIHFTWIYTPQIGILNSVLSQEITPLDRVFKIHNIFLHDFIGFGCQ